MLFCENIGDRHHQEVRELFDYDPPPRDRIRTSTQLRDAMQRNGLNIRLVSDMLSKRYYADICAWLQFQSAIWAGLECPC